MVNGVRSQDIPPLVFFFFTIPMTQDMRLPEKQLFGLPVTLDLPEADLEISLGEMTWKKTKQSETRVICYVI